MRVFQLTTLLSCALALPAAAADRPHLNRCSDATTELRGATAPMYKDRDVEPKEVQAATAHLNQHVERFNRAQKFLDSAGPWDQKDPDLAECVTLLQRERAYIENTSKKLQAAKALAVAQAPVLEAAKGDPQKRALYALATILVSDKTRVFDNLKPAEARAQVDSLAPVDAACQKAFPDTFKTAPVVVAGKPGSTETLIGGVAIPSGIANRVEWWCYVSAHRTELATKALANVNVVAEHYGNHVMAFEDVLKPGDAWSGAAPSWIFEVVRDEKPFVAALKKAVAEWYTAFGVAMPAEPFPGLAEQIAKLRAAVPAAAARNHAEPTQNHDKAMEAGAKAIAVKLYPKVTTVATWMNEAGYIIDQNSLGIPIDRYRSGQIVYRVGNDPWCLKQSFTYLEPHMGGGKYQTVTLTGLLGGAIVMKCP